MSHLHTYRILRIHATSRDDFPDQFIAIGIEDRRHAEIMCRALNEATGYARAWIFKVVDNNYRIIGI